MPVAAGLLRETGEKEIFLHMAAVVGGWPMAPLPHLLPITRGAGGHLLLIILITVDLSTPLTPTPRPPT